MDEEDGSGGGEVNAVDACGAEGRHEWLKRDLATFLVGTMRLPHRQHDEAIQDGLIYRNCPRCHSTLALEIVEISVAA